MARPAARLDDAVNADGRLVALVALAVLPVTAVFLLADPYPQPAGYFQFADTRPVGGVPNFWNVTSNLLFLVFGGAGILLLCKGRLSVLPDNHLAYAVFFAAIALTAIGSGWFHLAPTNDSLVWDRLPMTMAFMSLFAIILGEHISPSLGRKLLLPLLVTGAASVIYWSTTEAAGKGDLRAYGLVQFLPMLLIPAVLLMYPSAFDRHRFLWGAFALYALAKIFEALDPQILSLGGIVSGHSLKHLVASIVPMVLIEGMRRRNRR